MSQFHYGSIQIKMIINRTNQEAIGLNSTMVRFKLSKFEMPEAVSPSQFHYGSIQIVQKKKFQI